MEKQQDYLVTACVCIGLGIGFATGNLISALFFGIGIGYLTIALRKTK
mgnify:CR=1 FL=1